MCRYIFTDQILDIEDLVVGIKGLLSGLTRGLKTGSKKGA